MEAVTFTDTELLEGTITISLGITSTEALHNDIEYIKKLNAPTNEIQGVTAHGFKFRKFLNSIVIF
jgi:hypothetical protein